MNNDFDERDCWDDEKPVALPSWSLWALAVTFFLGIIGWVLIVKGLLCLIGWK